MGTTKNTEQPKPSIFETIEFIQTFDKQGAIAVLMKFLVQSYEENMRLTNKLIEKNHRLIEFLGSTDWEDVLKLKTLYGVDKDWTATRDEYKKIFERLEANQLKLEIINEPKNK